MEAEGAVAHHRHDEGPLESGTRGDRERNGGADGTRHAVDGASRRCEDALRPLPDLAAVADQHSARRAVEEGLDGPAELAGVNLPGAPAWRACPLLGSKANRMADLPPPLLVPSVGRSGMRDQGFCRKPAIRDRSER